MKVILTPSAEADFVRIGDYIAADNIDRARSFVRELRQKTRQSADAPRAFTLIPHYEYSGVRRRPFGSYLIFYRIDRDRIYVLHILHGSQDYRKILFPEE